MMDIVNWERNGVFEEGKNTGQKAIVTMWGHHRESQGGKSVVQGQIR